MMTALQSESLQRFLSESAFASSGTVITDLDGTAIHEYQGHYIMHEDIERGLKKIYEQGRPVIINTLRFPLSVMRSFGQEWYRISSCPIPTVLMNGSQLGYILMNENADELIYEELAAFPLPADDIDPILNSVEQMVKDGADDLLLFYYPRDWRKGEIIWTPFSARVKAVAEKYPSAEQVYACSLNELRVHLFAEDICMIFLLLNLPGDKLMAYQHTERSNFFNAAGVNKQTGAERLVDMLGCSISDSVGAGDSGMDTFLSSTGFSIWVGRSEPKFSGRYGSIHVPDTASLGQLLDKISTLQKSVPK
jgi:hydroxymethylpyrimidine pyrophosphatase-like HAD family hydrolase